MYPNPKTPVRRRLFDIIAEQKRTEFHPAQEAQTLLSQLKMPVFVFDNVYNDIVGMAMDDDDETVIEYNDIIDRVKRIIPPFSEFFVEWWPWRSRSILEGVHFVAWRKVDADRWEGPQWLVNANDNLMADVEARLYEAERRGPRALRRFRREQHEPLLLKMASAMADFGRDSATARWFLVGWCYMSAASKFAGPICAFSVEIEDDGMIRPHTINAYEPNASEHGLVPDDIEVIRYHLMRAAITSLYGLALLSAGNITQQRHYPPERYQKTRTGEGKLRLVDYITIKLDQPNISATKRGGSGPQVFQRRGHIKVYTEDRPLFGRHVGSWYWGPIISDPENPAGYGVEDLPKK